MAEPGVAESLGVGPAEGLNSGIDLTRRHGLSIQMYYKASTPVLKEQGVGIWVGFQSFINIGVNLGALPTKGLTLPLMSYGGSAILLNLVAIAVVLRVDFENRVLMHGGRL